jgi:hypothetical protein
MKMAVLKNIAIIVDISNMASRITGYVKIKQGRDYENEAFCYPCLHRGWYGFHRLSGIYGRAEII